MQGLLTFSLFQMETTPDICSKALKRAIKMQYYPRKQAQSSLTVNKTAAIGFYLLENVHLQVTKTF